MFQSLELTQPFDGLIRLANQCGISRRCDRHTGRRERDRIDHGHMMRVADRTARFDAEIEVGFGNRTAMVPNVLRIGAHGQAFFLAIGDDDESGGSRQFRVRPGRFHDGRQGDRIALADGRLLGSDLDLVMNDFCWNVARDKEPPQILSSTRCEEHGDHEQEEKDQRTAARRDGLTRRERGGKFELARPRIGIEDYFVDERR